MYMYTCMHLPSPPTPPLPTPPHSQTLYSLYRVEGGSENIGCTPEVVGQIASSLRPAYEDLFDDAEQHALLVLLEQWVELSSSDDQRFQASMTHCL